MRYALITLLAAAAIGAGAAGPTATTTAGLPTVDMLRDEACACTTQECADRVMAALRSEREQVEKAQEQGQSCLASSGVDPRIHELLRRMEGYREKLCECADKACVDEVQKEMMEWALKTMDWLEEVVRTASKAQEAEFERIDEEMRRCQEVIEGPARPAP